MRKTKHVLFTFSPYEYKGVEAYLNSQAARGWELENVNPLGVARFRRAQRADLRYCTDLLSYRRRREGRQAEREYLELCRGGGLGAGGPVGEHGAVRLPARQRSGPHPDRPGH